MVRHSDYVSELHFEHISKTREIAIKYVNDLFVMMLMICFNFGPALGRRTQCRRLPTLCGVWGRVVF